MIRNRFRQKLQPDRCTIGVGTTFVAPEFVEFCGFLGFDWIFVDGEHGGAGPDTCQMLVRAAHAADMGVLVRVPSADPAVILGYLETGAFSILVPHINTPDEARAAVSAGRYPPLGIRGAGSSTRAANYGLTQSSAEYFARANTEVLIIPQIEDVKAVENLDDILGLPEVEAVMIGPGDLAASMGYPGQGGHPEVVATVDKVISRARAAGRMIGTTAGTPAAVRNLRSKGVGFALCSAASMLAEAARRFLHDARAES